jgi:hypothetical protein
VNDHDSNLNFINKINNANKSETKIILKADEENSRPDDNGKF